MSADLTLAQKQARLSQLKRSYAELRDPPMPRMTTVKPLSKFTDMTRAQLLAYARERHAEWVAQLTRPLESWGTEALRKAVAARDSGGRQVTEIEDPEKARLLDRLREHTEWWLAHRSASSWNKPALQRHLDQLEQSEHQDVQAPGRPDAQESAAGVQNPVYNGPVEDDAPKREKFEFTVVPDRREPMVCHRVDEQTPSAVPDAVKYSPTIIVRHEENGIKLYPVQEPKADNGKGLAKLILALSDAIGHQRNIICGLESQANVLSDCLAKFQVHSLNGKAEERVKELEAENERLKARLRDIRDRLLDTTQGAL